ncbi:hypothetical protein RHSIM_Rhsim09G0105900 [Rhododendron simsii]|uniref:DUF1639 family protein n=1 Tax=Rhododendron simsii TaxID=118357 RepID=A0A834LEV1_RHOSS|nr:hypothetical protein RHSIM_Rhsim09G0105900 [Rhododendron simsii]
MVDVGKRRKRETEMDVGPERSRPLHNFQLPRLKWGNQRVLRCMIVQGPRGGGVSSDRAAGCYSAAGKAERGLIGRRGEKKESLERSPEEKTCGGWGKSRAAASEGDGIEAVREKLMFDLQAAADRMKDAILREGMEEEEPIPPPAPAPEVAPEGDGDARPWNLRTRRAGCKAPNGINGAAGGGGVSGGCGGGVNGGVGKGLRVGERREANFSPLRHESESPRLAGDFDGEKRERSRFSVSLSRREIEEDFRALTGNRPPRRPKKRPKIVQKELDILFPGLWLTEVTADMYKVPDAPEP